MSCDSDRDTDQDGRYTETQKCIQIFFFGKKSPAGNENCSDNHQNNTASQCSDGYQTIQILSWSVITNLHSFPQAPSTVSGISDCEL